jgi:hypothetical protein
MRNHEREINDVVGITDRIKGPSWPTTCRSVMESLAPLLRISRFPPQCYGTTYANVGRGGQYTLIPRMTTTNQEWFDLVLNSCGQILLKWEMVIRGHDAYG